MLDVDDAACDGRSEKDFTEVATVDDVKYLNSLLVSSKPASESDQIWIELLKVSQVNRFLICWSFQMLVERWA